MLLSQEKVHAKVSVPTKAHVLLVSPINVYYISARPWLCHAQMLIKLIPVLDA